MPLIASRLSWSVLLKVFAAILAFVFMSLVSRTLTVEDAGTFFFLMSGLILLSMITLAGRDIYAMRTTTRLYVSDQFTQVLECGEKSRKQAVFLTSIMSFLLATLYFSSAGQLIPSFGDEAFILAFILPFYTLTIINCELLRGTGQVQSLVIFHGILLPALSGFLIGGLSIVFDVSLTNTCLAYFLAIALIWAFSEWNWRSKRTRLLRLASGKVANAAGEGESSNSGHQWLALLAISNIGFQYFPVILLGGIGSANETALFFVALKLSSLLSFCLIAINVVIAPLMAKAYQLGDSAKLKQLMKTSNFVGFFTSAPLLATFFFFGHSILQLFGNEYVAAFNILMVLALGHMVNACCGSVLHLLVMTGHERAAAIITFLCLILGIVASYIFWEVTILFLAWVLTLSFMGINFLALVVTYVRIFRQ